MQLKTKKLCILFSLIIVVIGLLNLDFKLFSISPLFSKASPQKPPAPEVSDESVEFFKTTINPELGTYAVVNADRTTVSLKDRNNHVIWSTNIALPFKNYRSVDPFDKQHIISMIITNPPFVNYPTNKVLFICFGTWMLGIDMETGHVTAYGSD